MTCNDKGVYTKLRAFLKKENILTTIGTYSRIKRAVASEAVIKDVLDFVNDNICKKENYMIRDGFPPSMSITLVEYDGDLGKVNTVNLTVSNVFISELPDDHPSVRVLKSFGDDGCVHVRIFKGRCGRV